MSAVCARPTLLLGCRLLAVVGGAASVFRGLGAVVVTIVRPRVGRGVLEASSPLMCLGAAPVRVGGVLVGLFGEVVRTARGPLGPFDGLFGRSRCRTGDIGAETQLLDSIGDLFVALNEGIDATLCLVTPLLLGHHTSIPSSTAP
jgi:hypothetical protein